MSSLDYVTLLHDNNDLRAKLVKAESMVKACQNTLTEQDRMSDALIWSLAAEILLKLQRGQDIPLRILQKPSNGEPHAKGTLYMTKTDLTELKEMLNHKEWSVKEPSGWDSVDEGDSTYEELMSIAIRVSTDTG